MLPHFLAALLVLTPPADTTADTTYYVTNRARHLGRLERGIGDSLEFGFVVSQMVGRSGLMSGERLLERVSARQVDSVRLTRADFLTRLHSADSVAAASGESTVFYVHGFATSFRRSLAQGAEIAHRGRFGGPFVVFAWPGHTGFVVFPSAHAFLSRAYREDSTSAGKSAASFRAALTTVLGATRPRTLTLVGHSLGAQLVTEALRGPSQLRDSLTRAPLRALVLFAPDIAADRFRDSLAASMAELAARRVVYVSSSDRLLAISRFVNHTDRAGQSGGARRLGGSDVEIIDVTHGRRADRNARWLVDWHHSMRAAGSALFDFFGVVRGRPADCRTSDGVAERVGVRSWRLRDVPPPEHQTACQASVPSDGTRGALN